MEEKEKKHDEDFIENLVKENVEQIDDFFKQVTLKVNRFYEEVTVSAVSGTCPYGHKEGDTFKLTCMNSDTLCGSLYQKIHPELTTLHYGGGIPWGEDPLTFTGVCAEGKVSVVGKRIQQPQSRFVKTRSQTVDMTGKGFPGIDKYRVFLEVISVANKCEWGHCANSKKMELDLFNIGDVCGFLYWEIYHFVALLFAGEGLPWEADQDIIHGVCPDSYNQVTYRLIREKR